MVNLRAELEIMRLHDKLDALRSREVEALITQQTEALTLLKEEVRRMSGASKPAAPAKPQPKPKSAARRTSRAKGA